MNKYSKKELEDFEKLFRTYIKSLSIYPNLFFSDCKKSTVIEVEDCINETITYNNNLTFLSKLYNTNSIDIGASSWTSGCPTCDYDTTTTAIVNY
jgi:hypothetical protein